jgi:hypothetical protein
MKKFKLLIGVYLMLQISLYAMFLIVDLAGENAGFSITVKFIVILLCFLYVMLPQTGSSKRDYLILRLALLFTLISDFIILFMDANMYKYGMLTFLTAQQLHGIRLSSLSSMYGARTEPSLIDRFSLRLLLQALIAAVLYAFLLIAGVGIDILTIIVALYFISLVFNVVRSARLALLLKGNRQAIALAAGFFLFLLCDINVGIFNLSDFIPVAWNGYSLLYSIASILMWLFYAPSQVLISLSIHPAGKKEQK